MHDTATAHHSWDERWRSGEGREEWLNPDPVVLHWGQARREDGAETALDLGCGIGRHSLALARLGFVTTAFDASLAGLEYAREAAEEEGLAIIFERGEMTALPFPDASFDYVLALNVIYHGDADVVRKTLQEVRRVLKPGGVYQGTMLSKRNARYGEGTEIAPDTYIRQGAGGDKDHPHFYCNAAELVALFEGFEVLALEDREQKGPGTWHWYVVAEPV
ncbi:MAG: class I SAM-dependent methyltransferase [Alphaproteobacteria bacterium]|nr:class I SAM-dependent methyltransferase [Alphaproteobacteria bacterium]MCB9931381.1 class I SAM-dependent methyltransferase [Alphaproteobacteria bacterium]